MSDAMAGLQATDSRNDVTFLNGGGEMGALMRAYDWSTTPAGRPEKWPASLRTAVQLMLNTSHPMYLFWGDESVCMYNDAYSKSIGPERHPRSLGQPGQQVWDEIWDEIGPQIAQVMDGTGATWHENQLIPLTRNGRRENTYWTYSYSPIGEPDAQNGVGGVLVLCWETTQTVLATSELHEIEARFQQIADAAPVPMWVTQLDRQRSFVNKAYLDFINTDYETALTFDWRTILHPDDHDRIVSESMAGEASLAPFVLEARYKGNDGRWYWLRSESQPRWGPDGAHIGFIGIAHDVTAARESEAYLRESEQRFRELFENANDFIFTTDLEMRITSCNPAVANALERKPEELLGQRISNYTPPETWEHNKAMLADKLAGKGDATRYEVEVFNRTGERMVWEINSRLIRDMSGQPSGLHAIGRDVTERRRSEQALSAQNSRLNLLARIAGELNLDKSTAERLHIVFNDIAREVSAEFYFNYLVDDDDPQRLQLGASLGLTDEQRSAFSNIGFGQYLCGQVAANRSPVILDDIDQSEDFSCAGVKALGGKTYAGFPLISEGRLIGTIAFSSTTRSAFSAEEVAVIQTVADQIAATLDRGRILAELNISREAAQADAAEIAAILSQLAEGVIITDPTGKITFVNDAATRLHGVTELGVEPSEYSETYHLYREDGSPYPFDELPLTTAVREGNAVIDARWRIRRPDGSEVLAIGSAQPVLGLDGVARGAVLTIRDDTARNAAEVALRELNDTLEERVAHRTTELEQAQEALRHSQKLEAMGQLTGGVAHDFNNLLTPIMGSLDLLHRRGIGDEREQRLIEGALQSAERAKLLVQRLLAFARRQPLKTVAVDIRQLISGMADLISSTCGPGIKVSVKVEDDVASAIADPNQLEMAILNLSVNARDAMPDGGRLTLAATSHIIDNGTDDRLAPGRYVRLSVTDNGSGMDDATARRAVEPFFSTKGIGKGTGLGLSMAHGLASQLGGVLTISSAIGVGTNVELWLPASDEKVELETPTSVKSGGEARAGKVLLVDDEMLVRESTAHMLVDLGYDVVEAETAEQALDIIDTDQEFDMLVSDYLMPGMNGVDLAHAVRDRQPHLPVLIVSGYAETGGVPAYLYRLTKPFRQSDLELVISEMAKLDDPFT